MRVDEHTPKAPELKHRASHQGVGVEEGIRKMRVRLIPERPAEEEDSRKGPEEGRGSASLVQGSGMMSWTRHGKGEGNGGTEKQEGRRKDGGGGAHHEDRDTRGAMKSEEEVELQQAVEVGEQQECWRTVEEEQWQRGDEEKDEEEHETKKTRRSITSGSKWRQTLGPVHHIYRLRFVGSGRRRRGESGGGAARGEQWTAEKERERKVRRRTVLERKMRSGNRCKGECSGVEHQRGGWRDDVVERAMVDSHG